MDAIQKHLRKESGVPDGHHGGVLFIQRFGSGANLNVHFHIVVVDGTYGCKTTGRVKFYPASAPTELSTRNLATDISTRVNNILIKKGYLEKHEDLMLQGNTEDIFAEANDNLHLPAQAASVSNLVAFGPNAGKPVRRLKNGSRDWPAEDDVEVSSTACVNVGGYSVHAARAIKAHERDRLEELVRYMARPAIADDRIEVLSDDSIRLKLKTPWRDGTEYLVFTPTEFRDGGPIEKLVALIPIPRFHLTRYYGVFVPRALPAVASRSDLRNKLPDMPEPPPAQDVPLDEKDPPKRPRKQKGARRPGKRPIGWAALLKRTFGIDVLACSKCGSRMTLVGVVFDSGTIQTTLNAIGVSPRAPPIAPARVRQERVFDYVDAFYEEQ
jgi:hypothetical protein